MTSLPPDEPVGFKQLVCCPWDGNDGRRTYSLFALGCDGKVYRHDRSLGKFRPVGSSIMTPPQMKAADKRKYGASYIEREAEDD